MPQKILAGRADDPLLSDDLVTVKVDQVVLTRQPGRTLNEAVDLGLKKAAPETAVAYDTRCVSVASQADEEKLHQVPRNIVKHGVLVARAGIGFPAAVHLERFAAPARLAVTDDARMTSVGGCGMLTLVTSPSQLASALTTGTIRVRPPRSVQILLSGRVRPFVCVRDVALELLRRGLPDIIQRIDREHGAPVVLEFAGPSARLLSVPERALLCALAPQLGAAGALFVSDEKTEVYLRDQRRSKAHRALAPDPGAPCDDVVTIDLSAVDPLLMDRDGSVHPVRDLDGKPVDQVILGGDSGASLRDMLAAAALLKSKRVPPTLDLLVAPPSRQVLEVLAQSGSLVDLIATGARLVEPDHRVISGELYPPRPGGLSLRTFNPDPGTPADRRFIVASAETLAYAVATGAIGDPRSFKRPVRVTVPRALPTDDVLVVRKSKGKQPAEAPGATANGDPHRPKPWAGTTTLKVVKQSQAPDEPAVFVLSDLDQVRWVARNAAQFSPKLRAVIASYLPTGMVPLFAGLGILTLIGDEAQVKRLADHSQLTIPAPEEWSNGAINVAAGEETQPLTWPAVGAERDWTRAGTAASAAKRSN